MLFVETVNRPCAVQVNATDHLLKNSERDTEQRAHMGLGHMSLGQALCLLHGPEAGHIGTQNGYSLLHHLAGDRAANPHQRRFPGRRVRACSELNSCSPPSVSRIAPRPAGTTSKIRLSNCPCNASRFLTACTTRLIFSKTFRLRATSEVSGNSLSSQSGGRPSTSFLG